MMMRDHAQADRERAAPDPAADDLAGGAPTIQPRSTTCCSSALSNVGDRGAELGQVVGLDVVAPCRRACAGAAARPPRPARSGAASSATRCASSTGSPGGGFVSMPTFFDSPSMPSSSRKAIWPRLARSSIAVVSARRDVPPSMTKAPEAAREVGRRGRHEDRRVVEVDRVLAEPTPVEAAPSPTSPRKTIGAPTRPEDRVDLATGLQRGRVLRRRRGVDLGERGGQGAVEVGLAQVREHVVLEDRLAFGCSTGTSPRSPAPAYSWTWPCSRDGSMSKRITSPSSKPLRPTPHWSISAGRAPRSPRCVTP